MCLKHQPHWKHFTRKIHTAGVWVSEYSRLRWSLSELFPIDSVAAKSVLLEAENVAVPAQRALSKRTHQCSRSSSKSSSSTQSTNSAFGADMGVGRTPFRTLERLLPPLMDVAWDVPDNSSAARS